MTLPDSALRRAREKQQAEAEAGPPAWIQRLAPEQIDALARLFPTCAVCRRPVEWLAWTSAPAPLPFTFTVRCHGAEESAEVPRELALRGEIAGGVAFAGGATTRLTAANG